MGSLKVHPLVRGVRVSHSQNLEPPEPRLRENFTIWHRLTSLVQNGYRQLTIPRLMSGRNPVEKDVQQLSTAFMKS